ncbi:MAG: hypothetical protein GEV13_13870 [Rhodospirillales bacterium]|jgi:uncharacterized coiled-coil protein SlyX|nr:hypothetical protein [Rhodospirillales bacterium]
MADSLEYLLGKISGQLDGLEGRMDDIKESVVDVSGRQRYSEERIGKLERREAHRSGMIAAIAGSASLLGSALVTFLTKKV